MLELLGDWSALALADGRSDVPPEEGERHGLARLAASPGLAAAEMYLGRLR
jgi:hypothetical protein